jgi:DNA repair exonuclease SbcCD ATPase subunit
MDKQCLHWQEEAVDLNLRAEKAERERDEAKAWLAEYERIIGQKSFNEVAAEMSRLTKERDEARAALEEREGDMHVRIREGYDRTVADSWRAHCAKIEAERDEARAALEWQAAATKARSESQERLAQEVKEAREEITALRTELRKQVFVSKVVYDRDVCARAEAENPDLREKP